ncbi:MAG: hypothetical protein OXI33_15465 [Chloroflexota bacterium]|nr:hypothetical protein [Chloroflexota bacterium]
MTSSPVNPLEATIEDLTVATWYRLRDIKAFSRRPEPFNSVRFGETTITDLAMLDLCRQRLTRSIFLQTPSYMETFWGTDFEWWLGSGATGWFRLAVQAKKLDMKKDRYLSLGHETRGFPQICVLEDYAAQNRATPLYCFYNYSGGVDPQSQWHCCQRWFRAEELGCSVTSPTRVREALNQRGMRTFDFIHRSNLTLPWQCLASCPKVQDAYDEARKAYGLQQESRPVLPFPLFRLESYYPALPPFRPQSRFPRFPLPSFGDGIDDDLALYDIEVAAYDDSLAEFYDLDVGIPRAINVTDLSF